jgi:hypothetical protein
VRLVVWFKRFVDPLVVPGGRKLDAAEYITAVPKAEHDAADWQVAWSPRATGRKRFRESRCCGPRQKRTAVSGRWRAHKKLARRHRKPLASETMPVGSDGQYVISTMSAPQTPKLNNSLAAYAGFASSCSSSSSLVRLIRAETFASVACELAPCECKSIHRSSARMI